jgi:hypothetical protein
MAPRKGAGSVYITLRVQPELLDQTDLKNGVDATLGGDGGTFWKRADSGAHRGLGGIWWGRSAPLGSLSASVMVWCLLVSSRTFWSSFLSQLSLILFHILILLTSFFGITLLKIQIHQNSWNLSV